jgi:hypothetical protein
VGLVADEAWRSTAKNVSPTCGGRLQQQLSLHRVAAEHQQAESALTGYPWTSAYPG